MQEHEFEYLLGLLLTDGWYYHNRYQIELKESDCNILEQFHKIIPLSTISYRTRDTNFTKDYTCGRLEIQDKKIIDRITNYWTKEDKTLNADIPKEYLLSPYLWLGILDGDGSFGFRGKKTPHISFVTKSEKMKDAFLFMIKEVVGQEIYASRNKRDSVYNLGVTSVNAKKLAEWFKQNAQGCPRILRKKEKMEEILDWEPIGRQGQSKKRWTKEEDDFVYNHSIKESCSVLNRTINAIRARKAKLMKERGDA